MIDPVEVVVVLNTSKEAAFDAFVDQINDWWPIESFSIANGTVSIDPQYGGKIIETAEDGTTHVWGHITIWDKPNDLAISWYVGDDKTPTSITVAFATTDDGRTGVTLVHTGWDALGAEGVKKRENYKMGWARILVQGYAKFARATCPPLSKGPVDV